MAFHRDASEDALTTASDAHRVNPILTNPRNAIVRPHRESAERDKPAGTGLNHARGRFTQNAFAFKQLRVFVLHTKVFQGCLG